ncbi:MAG: hypothetical protein ACLQAH_02550 [Limisphaerales bacterium]
MISQPTIVQVSFVYVFNVLRDFRNSVLLLGRGNVPLMTDKTKRIKHMKKIVTIIHEKALPAWQGMTPHDPAWKMPFTPDDVPPPPRRSTTGRGPVRLDSQYGHHIAANQFYKYMKIHKSQKSSTNMGSNTPKPCPTDVQMAEKATGADTVEPSPQSARLQELCGFHQFLQTWLANSKEARDLPNDLAVALLMEILWETRTWTNDGGATAVALEWSCSEWSRFGNQAEIHAALQSLGQEGIIRLVPCSCESTGQQKEMKFMVIELPWRDPQEE